MSKSILIFSFLLLFSYSLCEFLEGGEELKEMIEKSEMRLMNEKQKEIEKENIRKRKKGQEPELKRILYEQAAQENAINVSDRVGELLKNKIDMKNDEGCVIFYVRKYQEEIVDELKKRYKEPYWAISYYTNFHSSSRDLDDRNKIIRMHWSLKGDLSNNEIYRLNYFSFYYGKFFYYFYDESIYNKYMRNCQEIGMIPVGNTIDYAFKQDTRYGKLPRDLLLVDYLSDECYQDEDEKYTCPNLPIVCESDYLCSTNFDQYN